MRVVSSARMPSCARNTALAMTVVSAMIPPPALPDYVQLRLGEWSPPPPADISSLNIAAPTARDST